MNLPIIVHCRDSWDDILDIIEKNKANTLTGVFHSWTGDLKAMKKALGLGFYISFSGIVTFKNAGVIQEVAKTVPLNKFLIETDSPFLSPEPLRGKKNTPQNVKLIAAFLANLRNQSVNDISTQTTANAQKLFSIL